MYTRSSRKSALLAGLFTVAFLVAGGAMAQEPAERGVPPGLQDRVINLASNISLRLTAAAGRMSDIIARLDARIVKLEDEGVDTSAAQAKLRDAKSKLTDATMRITTMGSVQLAVRGDTPRESFRAIRQDIIAVRDGLKETKTLLHETIALLKEAVRAHEASRGASDAVSQDTI